MSYLLVVRPEVDADLIEVEAWYEQQESGLGREFLRAARETIDSLSANPLIYPGSFSQTGALGLPARVSLPDHFPRNSRHGGHICRRSCRAPRPQLETTFIRDERSTELKKSGKNIYRRTRMPRASERKAVTERFADLLQRAELSDAFQIDSLKVEISERIYTR